MSHLTWRYELPKFRASAVSELGTYRVQGGPGQRWVALFIPFTTSDGSTLSDAFTDCNFASLREAIKSCCAHAERCVRVSS